MGHKLKTKCVDSRVNAHDLASTGVPFTLTTMQVPNLALTHKKRITVCMGISGLKLEGGGVCAVGDIVFSACVRTPRSIMDLHKQAIPLILMKRRPCRKWPRKYNVLAVPFSESHS
jgi:hypothetical protein